MVRTRLLRKSATGTSGPEVLCGYVVEGHAGFGEHGSDVVCAAVSALAQVILFTLQDILGESQVECSVDEGNMRVSVAPAKAGEEGPRSLLRAFELGMRSIAQSYPQSVSIEDTGH
jgi:uncharacterized protein YsxB (DUF464 family)